MAAGRTGSFREGGVFLAPERNSPKQEFVPQGPRPLSSLPCAPYFYCPTPFVISYISSVSPRSHSLFLVLLVPPLFRPDVPFLPSGEMSAICASAGRLSQAFVSSSQLRVASPVFG